MKALQDPAPGAGLGPYQDADAARLLALRKSYVIQLVGHLALQSSRVVYSNAAPRRAAPGPGRCRDAPARE